jgi:restriction system protein
MARKKTNNALPSFDELMIPTVKAIQELGGSGSIDEINAKVYAIAEISDEILQIPHDDKGTSSEIAYRLTWTRNYLKNFGLLENSSRGIWALSKADIDVTKLDHVEIVKAVRHQNRLILPPKIKTSSEKIE